MPILLLDVDAWTGSAVETLRYATQTVATGPSDNPANTVYEGRIVDPGMFDVSFYSGNDAVSASVSVGSIVLNNSDGELDDLISYGFDGRAFVLKEINTASAPMSSAAVLLSGVLAGIDTSDALTSLRLKIRDKTEALNTELLSERYGGTSISGDLYTIDGDVDLTGQIKPRIWGRVTNIVPYAANPYRLIYQVSDAAVDSIQVYDGGVALTSAGNYADLQTLADAEISAGNYATCLSLGVFRLASSAVYEITADVTEGATLAPRSVAQVAQRVLAFAEIAEAEIDEASFDALDLAVPYETGIFVTGADSVLSVVTAVLSSVGAALVPTAAGLYAIRRLTEPAGAADLVLTSRDVDVGDLRLATGPSGDAAVPAWSVSLEYDRVWQTQRVGQVYGVDEARRSYLASATRTAVAEDASVLDAHPLSQSLTYTTLLLNQTDASAEAVRLLGLHSVRRDIIKVTIPDSAGRLALGSIVELSLPRFGLEAGKLFVLVGRVDDYAGRLMTLTLWG